MNGKSRCLILVAALGLSPMCPGQDEVPTKKFRYLKDPQRSLTAYLPDGWRPEDRRSALVIYRCNIPVQREYFRKLGMVVIKPQTAPVNSGKLPGMTLQQIAASPKPRDQVADTKSAIRFLRANAASLGIAPDKIVATGASGGGDLALQTCLNDSFFHEADDLSVSCCPDALVLYCPAFDGIDIWFVKNATIREQTRKKAPAFLDHLSRFIADPNDEYARPLDHRANLIQLAETLGREKGIHPDEVERFQTVLKLFNERDWQLLHPAEDALKMSATRLLTKQKTLPPTLILIGDRDHLAAHQNAFINHARKQGRKFELKVYRGGGHSFMIQPAFQMKSTIDVRAFLEERGILPVGKSR
jgi:acetyl esterase/lipase